jgi:predicted TIM-barrel fold metal-dependent hydrolase
MAKNVSQKISGTLSLVIVNGVEQMQIVNGKNKLIFATDFLPKESRVALRALAIAKDEKAQDSDSAQK